uniref:PNPLA domain-containing protein n=1 Tax=Esox lucius TaxID=8010 RepID=A0A3P9A9W1_ESOLU
MSVQAVNLSFAACGFLGIYQLGACGAILRHGDKLLGSLRACAGASAGALVAAMVVTAPEKLERVKEFTLRFAKDVRSQRLGAVTPGYDFMLTLRDGIEEFLPSNAHSIAGDRLHISITHSKSGKNSIVSHFASREDLIKLSKENIVRLNQSLFPPPEARMLQYCEEGHEDAMTFLKKENWIQ